MSSSVGEAVRDRRIQKKERNENNVQCIVTKSKTIAARKPKRDFTKSHVKLKITQNVAQTKWPHSSVNKKTQTEAKKEGQTEVSRKIQTVLPCRRTVIWTAFAFSVIFI